MLQKALFVFGILLSVAAFTGVVLRGESNRSVVLSNGVVEPSQLSLDFGNVVRNGDSPFKVETLLENKSSNPVAIGEIRTGCGCVVSGLEDHTVPAGQTRVIPFELKLPQVSTPFKQSSVIPVIVGGETSNVGLAIRGSVNASSQLAVVPPGEVYFGSLSEGESSKRTLRVFRSNGTPVENIVVDVQPETAAVRHAMSYKNRECVIELEAQSVSEELGGILVIEFKQDSSSERLSVPFHIEVATPIAQ